MDLHRLWKGKTAEVLLSRWDRTRHPVERATSTQSAVIEFLRSGSYARRTAGDDFLVDVNHVAFFNPHETLQFSHPCDDSNTGLTVRMSAEQVTVLLAKVDSQVAGDGRKPFRLPFAMTSSRCHLLQNALVRILQSGRPSEAIVDELVAALIREAATTPYRQAAPACSSGSRRPGAERVARIRRYVLRHWAERLTLVDLAEVAGCSIWHLASIFRAEVGVTLHAYLKRLRLRLALERLDDDVDLTRLALECGFTSHSHFTAAFRQEFGTTPSDLRVAQRRRSTTRSSLR